MGLDMKLKTLLKKTIVLSKSDLKAFIEERTKKQLILRRVKDSLMQELFPRENP